ncbi:MAG: hypothetical protein GX896_10175 [Clostridiales bacterium]|nr:hypothetical protein [Clostridiales bacterium]
MLEILQTKNIQNYNELIKNLKLDINSTYVVEATDNEIVNGIGVYHFDKNVLFIDYIDSESDLTLFDGIVRSILFLTMLKGIEKAIFNQILTETCVKLGLLEKNQNQLNTISDFLGKCKSCEK